MTGDEQPASDWQPLDAAEVLAVLEAGDDERLIGVYETEWLDFKGAPYRLDETRERWEFGKDVAALAGTGGGIIVIGVQVQKDPVRNEDIASKIAPFEPKRVDIKRYRDLLRADVYPPIRGLEIRPFDRATQRWLVAIVIPRQDDDYQPFLVTRAVEVDGVMLHAFALPQRSGSHTAFEPASLVHRDIADGRRFRARAQDQPTSEPPDQRVLQHARGSETERDTGQPPLYGYQVPQQSPAQATRSEAQVESGFQTIVADTEALVGWEPIAALFLGATPASGRRRPKDFYSVDGLRRALSPDHQLRRNGFGLTYGHDVRVLDRTLLSVDVDRTLLRVEAGGELIGGAAGTQYFLGWADESREGTLRVNPIALVEYVLEFCRFVQREMTPRWGAGWYLTSGVRRAQSGDRPLALRPGSGMGNWIAEGRRAEADERTETMLATGDPHADAFELLATVYSVFGLGPDAIPFVNDDRVDESQLLSLG